MAIEIKGDKTTIVFGYHDVLVGIKAEGDKGFLRLAHYPDGVTTDGGGVSMKDEEFFQLKELIAIRFEDVESLDVILSEVKRLKVDMLENRLNMILRDVKSRTEFPTKR